MRNIAISTFTFDLNGAHMVRHIGEIDALGESTRRATRTATLDGGALVYDTGFSASDRDIELTANGRHRAFFDRIVRTYRLVRVCTVDGVFSAIPARFRMNGRDATITLQIVEQIA